MIKKMNITLKHKILLSLLSLIIIFSMGCSSSHNLVDLKNDYFNKEFSSIVILKLKITDKSGTICHQDSNMENGNISNHFYSFLQDNTRKWDWIHHAINIQWFTKDGICYHEGLYVGQAKPSKCQLKWVHIYMSDSSGDYGINPGMVDKLLNFTVGQNEIAYLGTLNMVIENIEVDSTGKKVNLAYTYTISNDVSERSANIELFKNSYPKLFQKFNGKVNDVSWE
jgi:hypothetical protein